jgi:hypothetical protein
LPNFENEKACILKAKGKNKSRAPTSKEGTALKNTKAQIWDSERK